tara:strand:- start:41087 stop:41734 length:648 start_codon:yes stop_codon:yes gene_type:complete
MRLIYLTILLFFLLGCKKQNQPPKEECRVVDKLHTNEVLNSKNYIITKPGSWWTYQNGMHMEAGAKKALKTYQFDKEFFNCKYYNEDLKYYPVHPFFGTIDSTFQVTSDLNEYTTTYRPIIYKTEGLFYSRVEPGHNSLITYKRSVLEVLDSIQIQGETYFDIIKVEHFMKVEFTKGFVYMENKIYTLAKDIGVIRYEFPFQSIDAQLVDYYIEE